MKTGALPFQQRGFFIPNVPKSVWDKFQGIRKHYGLTQRQAFVLLVLAACDLAEREPEVAEKIVEEVKKAITGAAGDAPQPPPPAP